MSKKTRDGKQSQIKRRLTLGGEQAEADPLLHESFFETLQFIDLSTRDDPKCFIVGRTGSGKSAALQRIEEGASGRVIRITPEDLSLPYICDSQVIRTLRDNGVHLAPFFIALWKHIFLVEIIRHRYSIKSQQAKQNFFESLKRKISQDGSKAAALDYLNDYQDRFWCETDERVREITDRFERQVKAQAGAEIPGAPVRVGIDASGIRATETRTEIADRYQRIVNETQLARLNKMISVLDEDILEDPYNFTWVVIDDLDRDWVDEELVNELILSLFRAVVDMKRVRHLKILVALRTNIFRDLDFANRTGAQEEKFRSLTMHLRWTASEIREMLDQRASVSAGRAGFNSVSSITDILPHPNSRRGDALSFILRRTMLRPRDAIAYLNICLDAAGSEGKITWDVIESSELPYSNNRVMALRDEWKRSYPGLEYVIGTFSGAPAVIPPDHLLSIMENVALLLAAPEFSDRAWLMHVLQPVWNGGTHGIDDYMGLIEILFDIGFIGIRLATPKAVYSYDQPDLLKQHHVLPSIGAFVVHPTFWAALGIARRDDV